MIRVTRDRRLWLFGQRIHHGAVGIVLGLVLALHDRRDWRDWFKRGQGAAA